MNCFEDDLAETILTLKSEAVADFWIKRKLEAECARLRREVAWLRSGGEMSFCLYPPDPEVLIRAESIHDHLMSQPLEEWSVGKNGA